MPRPPATISSSPVMKAASFDARKTAAPATSSVVPHRRSAVSSRIFRSTAGSVSSTISVFIHPGQIAFPGGKIDPHDRTPADAALREAAEEIGLARALIEPIGYLDLYLTFSGFRILPTVARVASDYKLVLSEREVADAFEVPLTFLMDAQNHALHSRDWKGVTRRYYAMPFGERYIWGVTAGILRNLYERIYEG